MSNKRLLMDEDPAIKEKILTYEAHLKSAHFLTYKSSTQTMVKSLKLVDMEAVDPATMQLLFRKI
ncbi:MAG: hypothetical protein R2806_10755 [Saprospiraceae bacterium]